MKVALITPYHLKVNTGNAVTVQRIERYLSAAGVCVKVFSLDEATPACIMEGIKQFSPDLIHAFHGVRCGPLASVISGQLRTPFIITITGTDLYRVGDTSFSPDVREAIDKASAVVTFQSVVGKRFSSSFPLSGNKVAVIPQGVELPEVLISGPQSDTPFTFLLPAGIRPVKNIIFAFRPLSRLSIRYPQIRFVIAGPIIDPEYSEEVLKYVAGHSFSSWAGEVSHSEMPQLYGSASAVLNTSLSEGGMANSLLEGMAHDRPVLASDVEGNRSFLEDWVTGLLYSGEADFMEKAEKLILDRSLREKLVEAGRRYLLENCSPEVEAGRYIKLYERVI